MKLRNVKFMQDVLAGGRMVGRADEAEASALGVLIPTTPVVLVPWHLVRYADVVEGGLWMAGPEVSGPIHGDGEEPREVEVVSVDRERGHVTVDTPKRKRGKP